MKCKNCKSKRKLSGYICPTCGAVTKFPIWLNPLLFFVLAMLCLFLECYFLFVVFDVLLICFAVPYFLYNVNIVKGRPAAIVPKDAPAPAAISSPEPSPDPDIDLSDLKEKFVREYIKQNVSFAGGYLEKDLDASEDDLKIIEHFTNVIRDHFGSSDDLVAKRRSLDYISLFRNNRDILRFKYTERTKWLSFAIEDHYVSPDDPRFEAQKDKSQRFWKASISSLSDLSDFDDVFCDAYSFELSNGGD